MIFVKSKPENKKVYFGIDTLTRKHRKAIRNASFDIGKRLKDETAKNINNKGKKGRIYTINGKRHQASAPGQSPANLSGKLRDSVQYNVRGYREVEYGYTEFYGKFLEDGTVKMERRPNLRKVADDLAQTFINFMVRSYDKK